MSFDARVVKSLTVQYSLQKYFRASRLAYRATPLGFGGGGARFSSPAKTFNELYIAANLATSIAEALIRDRFEDKPPAERWLDLAEIEQWGVTEVWTKTPLRMLDLRKDGAFRLGIPSDAIRAAAHRQGQLASERIYALPGLDGILYPSRMTGRTCCMVYDRAVPKLGHSTMVDIVTLARLPAVLRTGLAVRVVKL